MLPVMKGNLGSGKNGCSWGGWAFSEASISSIQSEFGGGTVRLGALGVLPPLQIGLPPLIARLSSSYLRVRTIPVGVITLCGSVGSVRSAPANGATGADGVGGVTVVRVVGSVLVLSSFGVGSGSVSSVEGISVVATSISLAA